LKYIILENIICPLRLQPACFKGCESDSSYIVISKFQSEEVLTGLKHWN